MFRYSSPVKRSWPVVALLIAVLVGSAASAATLQQEYPWQSMEEQTFAAGAGGTLRVRVDDADVAVTADGGSNATIAIRLRSNDMDRATDLYARSNYRIRQDGGTILVESDRRPNNEGWRDRFWMSVVVDVRLPERFALDLSTGDGDVSLGSHEGEIRVQTHDGDITATELRGGEIGLRSEDGDISATSLSADRIETHTEDGDITVESLRGEVTMRTRDGDIRIGAASSDQLLLDTGDGDIHVAIGDSARMDASTQDGDISIVAPSSLRARLDLSGEDVSIHGNFRVSGRIHDGRAEGDLNGGGERIRARTHDGSIRLVEGRQR